VHKLIVRIAVTAGIAMLAGTAVALAGPNTQQRIILKVSPSEAGTAKKPKSVSLTFETGTSEPDGTQPPTMTQAVIYFPRGLKFNAKKFPSCDMETLEFEGKAKCPLKSRVGSGSATAVAGTIVAEPTVTPFNGPGGNKLLLLVEMQSPIVINAPMEATLTKVTGKYSYKLTLPIPAFIQEPGPGILAAITRFTVKAGSTITRDGRKYGYIETVSCPASHEWKIKGVFTARDGQQLISESTARCT